MFNVENNNDFRLVLRNEIGRLVQLMEENGYDIEGFRLTFDNDKIYQEKWKPRHHFAKVYNTELANIIKNYKLDSYELSAILLLLPYVEYETNLIAEGGVALRKKDMAKVLDYSENKTDDVINSLVHKKILAKTKVGRTIIFHMNPYLAFRGIYLSPETESIFRNL